MRGTTINVSCTDSLGDTVTKTVWHFGLSKPVNFTNLSVRHFYTYCSMTKNEYDARVKCMLYDAKNVEITDEYLTSN